MFCEKALELVKELKRCPDSVPPYNDNLVREVSNECNILFDQNQKDRENEEFRSNVHIQSKIRTRDSFLNRNKRILLAYSKNRMDCIKQMRWEFGSVLPPEIKANLSMPEVEWFNSYSKNLSSYMKSIGDYGLDLTQNIKPPKSIFIEVRCLQDFGKMELNDGRNVFLKKNTHYLLPRSDCESLIRQGILEHIN